MGSLVQNAKNGDEESFIALVEEQKTHLYKIAKIYLRREEDVADALQDTVLSAYEHLGNLRTDRYFRAWITKILINKCLQRLETLNQEILVDAIPEQEYFDEEEKRFDFIQTLELLPGRYREVFLLYYGEGFGIKEVAELLEISENTVKTWLRRGKEKLKRELEKGRI